MATHTSSTPPTAIDPLDMAVPMMLGINPLRPSDGTGSDWDRCGIKDALTSAGIMDIETLSTLRRDDLKDLVYVEPSPTPGGPGTPRHLPTYAISQMLGLIAFYHCMMGQTDGNYDWMSVKELRILPEAYRAFFTGMYVPENPIKNWRLVLHEGSQQDKKALENWNKSLRINAKDFPVFKDGI